MALSLSTAAGSHTWRSWSVGAAWQWWVNGLLGCLPRWLRTLLIGKERYLFIQPHADGILVWRSVQGVTAAATHYPWATLTRKQIKVERSTPLVLQMPAAGALAKELTLPLAAAANLRQVLGYEMDRITPFKANQLYYDALLLEQQPAQKRIRVRLSALPRSAVDAHLEALAAIGLYPDALRIVGEPSALNLLPLERRPRRGVWSRRLLRLLASIGLALALAAALLPLWQQRTIVIALQKKVDTLQRQSGEILALREQLEKATLAAQFLTEKKQNRPPMVELLRELTAILPDHSWLERLQIKGDHVQLIGQSASAPALLGVVEASRWLNSAAFTSPVTNDRRTGKDRFVMEAKIAPEPATSTP